MFVLDESRKSGGALGEKFVPYLRHQTPCNALAPEFGHYREAIDVPAPAVPSTDHRANNLVVDRCY